MGDLARLSPGQLAPRVIGGFGGQEHVKKYLGELRPSIALSLRVNLSFKWPLLEAGWVFGLCSHGAARS